MYSIEFYDLNHRRQKKTIQKNRSSPTQPLNLVLPMPPIVEYYEERYGNFDSIICKVFIL